MTRRKVQWISWDESVILGRNVRALRADRGMTIAKLAEMLSYHNSGISRKENGSRRFCEEDVPRLMYIFGVTRAELTLLCANCHGKPPAGFACLTCGTEGDR